jgi:hypothetical protein
MSKLYSLFFIMLPLATLAAEQAPYAGQEQRTVKSLSANEIQSLQNGGGMGFAKLAELNHFPGPKHVLGSRDELKLSPSQIAATEVLYEKMRRNAVVLGEELLLAESRLDQDFEAGTIRSESLHSALIEIGTIRARLRYVHLEAHLRQKQLLTAEQILKYDELRGYQGVTHDPDPGRHSHTDH